MFRDVAVALGENVTGLSDYDAGNKVVSYICELNKSIGIPSNTEALGVKLDMLPQMIADSMRSGNVLVNPRLTTSEDIKNIIVDAHKGDFS